MSEQTSNQSSSSGDQSSKRSSRFGAGYFWGFVTMLILAIVIPLIIGVSGVVNVSAQKSAGPIDSFLFFAAERSIAFHATDQANPHADDPQAVKEGMKHYKEMCLVCHGAPGLEPSEIAAGLHPMAPDLAGGEAQELTDGELFWVIANGITSTGMPAFEKADDADTRWKIVSYIRHLPKITDAEREQLRSAQSDEDDEAGGASSE